MDVVRIGYRGWTGRAKVYGHLERDAKPPCRYTLTYTPSEDRILPPPSCLHVRIRNSSAIPLRAAYLHGPYTIHVSAYPSTFNPNKKADESKIYGEPDFEPNVKAGGYWNTKLIVPEEYRNDIRE